MEYSVVKKININRDRCVKVGAFLYDKEVDGLYLDSPWPFPVQIGMTDGLSHCEVTPGFLKLPFILKGWVNHDILLRMCDVIKLALIDRILMHGSCVDNTLIIGFPNAGKTYQTYKMVAEGGTLVSEEYTVIEKADDQFGWRAVPYKNVMRTCFSARTLKDCKIPTTLKERLWLFCSTIRAAVMPFMFEAVIWKEIPVSGQTRVIKKIVYGSTGNEVKDWRKFAILCENEFPYMASEFLQAYAVATGFNLLQVQEKQRKLIKEFVNGVYPSHRK